MDFSINYYQGRSGDNFYLHGQTLDFYLPKHKIGIECQGDQHFIPVDFGNKGEEFSIDSFRKILLRDSRKYSECEKNGIKLIYYCNKNNIHHGREYFGELYDNLEDLIKNIKIYE